MAPGSRPQTVPTPLWPTQACTTRAATAGIAESASAWLPGEGLPGDSFFLPGSASGLRRAPGSREKALGRPTTTGTGTSSTAAFHQESWASFLSQPRSCCTTAAGTVRTARSKIISQRESESQKPKDLTSIVKGQVVVDRVSGRKGLAKAVSRSHCKVDFDDVEDGSDGVGQITELSRLEIWTPAWESGQRVKCHAARPMWSARESLPNFGQRRPVLGSLMSKLVSARGHEKQDPAADEKKGLLKQLAAPFGGSLVSAWHHGIDTRHRGTVSFPEFTRALRSVGFTGSYSRAWKLFVGDEREEMTLADLEPAAKLIETFKANIIQKYACVQDLWELCLDKYGVGRCCFETFCFSCSEASLEVQDARRLWNVLTRGGGNLIYEDLQIFGLPQREEVQLLPPKRLAKDIKKEKEEKLGVYTLRHFRDYLSRRYGNLICAWRVGLDPDGDGKMQFAEFCAACRNVGFKGNLKRLWCSLDDDNSGYISMNEIDPEGTALIHELKDRLLERYQTLEEVWDNLLDPDRSGKCTLPEFQQSCQTIGIGTHDAKYLFRLFDASGGGDISMDEIDWIGVPRRQEEELTATQKLQLQKQNSQMQAQNMLDEFKAFLCRMYKNLVVAWRRGLDPDGDGRLQFTEFCSACRSMQFQGNLKALWKSLDSDGTGYVSLEELDPEAVGHLSDFTHLLSVFFGSIEEAWYSCLDRDGSERCTIEDFQSACAELGYFRAPKKLFKYLDLGQQGDITIDELYCLGLPHASYEEGRAHAKDDGQVVRDQFRKHFKDKYKKNLVLAWRLCFCTGPPESHWEEAHNSVHFCGVSRKEGFKGNMHAFWVWLSNSTGTTAEVTLKDIDPQGHITMQSYKRFVESKYGLNYENVWFALLEKCPRADVTRKHFLEASMIMGFQDDAGYVFDALDIQSRGRLYDSDLKFLQTDEGNKVPITDAQRSSVVKRASTLGLVHTEERDDMVDAAASNPLRKTMPPQRNFG
eukprot:gnl/MRDRNA2_/MRDRNA2_106129_c0_seq1.p1 gnl/MRDRNA2_/MRDRNA2_106129_c0~~gnl/MRDRNA2_/MRDRNA2_106129_c0_seq1.p1  ORF type:complete len:980 (+),score=161.72 gnl/MRDRNA2_/MRDRNA2_106129_c0_seq1:132-3071(+)